MVLLYILLSLIVLIIFLLFIKVVLDLDYHDKLVFDIKWLFIKYRVYPSKAKKAIEDAPSEPAKKSDNSVKKKEKSNIVSEFYHNQGLEGLIELVQKVAASVSGILKRTVKAIVIRDFNLYARITGDDSAKTAVNYGVVCAALYPAIGTINSAVCVKKQQIDISPDFLGDSNRASFSAVVAVTPIKLTNAVVIFALQVLFGVMLKLFLGSRKNNNRNRKADKT